ncbi:conserved hypothetical protein [Vibrio chagasii]|nr:conserved hypothetical protein [Vibrio chagasii]CAH7095930.1 conserved hypothetical protein [Vibrio chagasii]CAH7204025.1 conserved hypothetical protein [Vibrio chagasii]CAH7292411.1 conserved hypothetical protein [Vibrio chagasii]
MSVDKFLEHLEFYGYQAEKDEDGDWLLTRDRYPRKILCRSGAQGFNFSIGFSTDEVHLGLEKLNKLNNEFWLGKVSNIDDDVISYEAWTPSIYNKEAFAIFFERFMKEQGTFVEALLEANDKDK